MEDGSDDSEYNLDDYTLGQMMNQQTRTNREDEDPEYFKYEEESAMIDTKLL